LPHRKKSPSRPLPSTSAPNSIPRYQRIREIPYYYTSFSDREVAIRFLGRVDVGSDRGAAGHAAHYARGIVPVNIGQSIANKLRVMDAVLEYLAGDRPEVRAWEGYEASTEAAAILQAKRDAAREAVVAALADHPRPARPTRRGPPVPIERVPAGEAAGGRPPARPDAAARPAPPTA